MAPATRSSVRVEDVLAVLAVAGDRAHLVGHSGGAIYSLLTAIEPPPLRSLVLYEPPLRFERFDPSVIDQVPATLDASDEDRALEIVFAAIGVAGTRGRRAPIGRSGVETAQAGVHLVPRELQTGLEAIDRLNALDPPGYLHALPLRREDRDLDLLDSGRGCRTVAEGSTPRPPRTATPRVRLRPNVVRRSGAAVHHLPRRLSAVVQINWQEPEVHRRARADGGLRGPEPHRQGQPHRSSSPRGRRCAASALDTAVYTEAFRGHMLTSSRPAPTLPGVLKEQS